MNIPEKFEVLIITLSDRAYRGEYEDLSGPKVREKVEDFFHSAGWSFSVKLTLIPDDSGMLKELWSNRRINIMLLLLLAEQVSVQEISQ